MSFTPQVLNYKSKGRWVKAHFVLPDGYVVGDVDVNRSCELIEPFELDVESEYVKVFVNDEGLVEVEAAFDPRTFCEAGISGEAIEVTVTGSFTDGRQFYGSDMIKIVNNAFSFLATVGSHWLESGCVEPDWCEGLDLNQDSQVNFVDYALNDGCSIEPVR
jgi:hypothetical protein